MDADATIWLLILVIGLGTYALRLSFIQLLGSMELPRPVIRLLRYVPPAVLSALILPALLIPRGALDLSAANPRIAAGLLAAVVAVASRNTLATIGAGLAALWVYQALLG
jgi:branched-subunit amino acid transport protein